MGLGGGRIVTGTSTSKLGFAEAGEVPGLVSFGGVGFAGAGGSGLGGYAEGELFGREAGGGAYVDIGPLEDCR